MDVFNQTAADSVVHPPAGNYRVIASLGDNITVSMEGQRDSKTNDLTGAFQLSVNVGKLEMTVAFTEGMGADVDAAGMVRRIVNQINAIEGNFRNAQREKTDTETEINKLTKKNGAPFEYQQAMAEKYGELKELESALLAEGEKTPAAPVTASINAEGLTAEEAAAPRDAEALLLDAIRGDATPPADQMLFSTSERPAGNTHTAETLLPALNAALSGYGPGFAQNLIDTGKVRIITAEQAQGIIGDDVRFSKASAPVAFYNPADGITYFIADAISKGASHKALRGLVLHEIASHALRLGRSDLAFTQLLNRFRLMKGGNKLVQEAYARADQAGTNAALMNEEALSYFLEANPDLTFSQQVVAWLRAAMRSLGNALPSLKRAQWFDSIDRMTGNDLIHAAQKALRNAPNTLSRSHASGLRLAPASSIGKARSPRFYSELSRQIANVSAKQSLQPAPQWALWLKANAGKLGVKKEEIEWSGITDYLGMRGRDKVTKDELVAFLDKNGVQIAEVPKDARGTMYWGVEDPYDQNSYDVPDHPEFRSRNEAEDWIEYYYTNTYKQDANANPVHLAAYRTDTAIPNAVATKYADWQLDGAHTAYKELLLTLPHGETPAYQSAHWDEKNIVAHIRFNDRVDSEGKKILFIEELQSDWGQATLKEKNVPNAPFIGDTKAWLSLGIKRMVAYAVENGYDKVAFINGKQSADRYRLSKSISQVMYNKSGEYLRVYDKNSELIVERDVKKADLLGIIGKELAEKVLNDPSNYTNYEGLALDVGGDGMIAFYDEIVPQTVNDVLRRIGGGKAENVSMATIKGSRKYSPQLGFSITDAIREKAESGLPLFSQKTKVQTDIRYTKKATVRKSAMPDEPDGTKRMYHAGTDPVGGEYWDSVPSGGLFDGMFALGTGWGSYGTGNDYFSDVPDEKILTSHDLEYELDHNLVMSAFESAFPIEIASDDFEIAWESVIADKSHKYDDDDLMRVFSAEDKGYAQWEAQRIRGLVAKKLGYQAVEMDDENGVSYLLVAGTPLQRALSGKEATTPDMRYSTKAIDSMLVSVWKSIAGAQDVFQYPVSQSKNLQAIASTVFPGIDVTPLLKDHPKHRVAANEQWIITMPGGAKAFAYDFGRDLQVDASKLISGTSRGSALYAALANYAHNTGKVFEGDSAGFSDAAQMRRLENMISSALKFGTTDHIRPHPDQKNPSGALSKSLGMEGISWATGDFEHNLAEMLKASYAYVSNLLPEIEHVSITEYSDFAGADGKILGDPELEDLSTRATDELRKRPSTPGIDTPPKIGSATIKRTAITGTILRGERSALGRQSLGHLGAELHANIGQARKILYSRGLGAALTNAGNNIKGVELPAGYLVGDLMNQSGKLHWWHKSIGTMDNLAKRNPSFATVYEAVQSFLGDVSRYAVVAADLAPTLLPKLETLADINPFSSKAKQAITAQDTKAIAAPIFEGTLIWARDEHGKPIKVKELEDRAGKLTTDQKAQILLRKGKIDDQTLKDWRNNPLDFYESAIDNRFAQTQLRPGVVWTDAELRDLFRLNAAQTAMYREFRAATDKSLTNLVITEMVKMGGKDTLKFSEVWQAKNRQIMVTVNDGRKDVMFLQLEPFSDNDYYRVNTAFPVRQKDYEIRHDMKLLWGGESVPTVASGAHSFAVSPPNAGVAVTMTSSQSSRATIAEPAPDTKPSQVAAQGTRNRIDCSTARRDSCEQYYGGNNIAGVRVWPCRSLTIAKCVLR